MNNNEANTTITATGKKHFETFDALRFLAFFKVFLLHIPIVAFPWFNFIKAGGGIGVQFFFVLSGFLITYIICDEKKNKGTLNLQNFFARRILRIWPLYYLMVLVAYTTPYILQHFLHLSSSSEGYEPQLWVSVLFLENYKMMITHQHANVSPLSIMWSLCIEEHFYILWGVTLYYTKSKRLPWLILSCIVLAIACRLLYLAFDIPTIDILSNVDLFAFGAIPAYLLIEKRDRLQNVIAKISFRAKLFFIFLLMLIVLLFSQKDTDSAFILGTTVFGALFSLLIIFVLPGKNQVRINDKSLIGRAGVYTYGLYLYHILVINLLKQIFAKVGLSVDNWEVALVFFITALLLTVICSFASYHLFEKQFLKLKRYFR